MSYGEQLVTPPQQTAVELARLREHVGIGPEIQDFDLQLSAYLDAATALFESETTRQVISATWAFVFDSFPVGQTEMTIPRAPLQSITAVEVVDANGNLQAWDSAEYTVDTIHQPGRIVLNSGYSWPVPGVSAAGVKVTAVCGYGDQALVPGVVKLAIMAMVDDWWNGRSGENEIGQNAMRIINSLKVGDTWLVYGQGN